MHNRTEDILNFFQQINNFPRCSKKEEQLAGWLKRWAQAQGFGVKADAAGNLAVKVPATPGYENSPIVILQAHLDMVCEKTPESTHDFSRDAIELVRDGDWVRAEGTSLGADNGIAIALAMAAVTADDVIHPPLELLFTTDEETGLNGAKEMATELIDGRILLNIDSEDEGVFTVGCAGGNDTKLALDLNRVAMPHGYALFRLSVDGLKGGHSGIDIHKRRANANKLLGRCLHMLAGVGDIRLVDMTGGTKHNAIPRNSEAVIAFNSESLNACRRRLNDLTQSLRDEYATEDKEMAISLERVENDPELPAPLASGDTRKIIGILSAMPHGVMGMSAEFEGLVETSTNLAIIGIEENQFRVLTSQRSSLVSKRGEITAAVGALGELAGAEIETDNIYPPWQPDMESSLLHRCRGTYRRLFDKEPVVEVIHAGLECAVIGDKYDAIEMISFGPTIENPHSPHERLYVPSLEPIWTFLTELLASYAKDPSG